MNMENNNLKFHPKGGYIPIDYKYISETNTRKKKLTVKHDMIDILNLNKTHYKKDYIEYFDNILSNSLCDNILDFYNDNKEFYLTKKNRYNHQYGLEMIQLDNCLKEQRHNSEKIVNIIKNTINKTLFNYQKKTNIDKNDLEDLESSHYIIYCLLKNKNEIPSSNIMNYNKNSDFIIIIFLNDVFIGGDIKFKYKNKRILARKGRVLMFPADFTYSFLEKIPITNNKYFIMVHLKLLKKKHYKISI